MNLETNHLSNTYTLIQSESQSILRAKQSNDNKANLGLSYNMYLNCVCFYSFVFQFDRGN